MASIGVEPGDEECGCPAELESGCRKFGMLAFGLALGLRQSRESQPPRVRTLRRLCSLHNVPRSTLSQLPSGRNMAHSGWPSTVLNACTHNPSVSVTSNSGSRPSMLMAVTRAPFNRRIPAFILRSVLQLPNAIDRLRSTRQLHSIMTVACPLREILPSGCRGVGPSLISVNLPSSRKSAEP